MKKMKRVSEVLLLCSVLYLSACDNAKSKQEEVKNVLLEEATLPDKLHPDVFFKQAVTSFDANDTTASIEKINEAIGSIRKIAAKDDSIHIHYLEFSIEELAYLLEKNEVGDILSSDQLLDAFSKVDQSIGLYQIAVTEEWVLDGINTKQSLIRLENALIRISNAVTYSKFALTDKEEKELAQLKESVENSDSIDQALWERVADMITMLSDHLDHKEDLIEDIF